MDALSKDEVSAISHRSDITDTMRAILTAYTGKMFIKRFRDLQDYAESIFGVTVPLPLYASHDFMHVLAKRAEPDFLTLPPDVIHLVTGEDRQELVS